MAQTLKYVIGKDYRPLTMLEAKSSNVSNIDYGANPNWVQARQYEDGLRQVFVEIANEDGTPFDLTGANVLFEGVLPDNEHKILDNEHAVFYEDPTSGKFRFDLPAQAFTVAGQYKQSFFRVMKGYKNIATLEFKLQVLADWVIGGLTPSDYISPLEKFFSQINDELLADKNKLKQAVDEFKQEVNDIQKAITDKSDAAGNMLDSLTQRIVTLETKIKNDDLFTNSDAVEYKLKINDEINDLKLSLLNTDKNLQTKATEISNKFDENLQTKTTKISDEFNEKIDKLNKTVTSSMSEAKTLVENKIAQMDNGVHGYPNANAIKQAYPNGAQGIFVAVDTGHQWYYVNGQWTDGGAYQSPRGNADATATALHNQMLDALDQQDKIWQRKLYVNVNTGEWLNDKNMRETQSNWCWTPYYTPVKKNSDYIFAGYDGVSANSKVVGISSVYINLYSSDKSFIKQIYTNRTNPGIFNTENAEYIRFSMSTNTFSDEQYPSLFKGNTLPKEIENDIYGLFDTAYKQLGNSLADFKLPPSLSLPKMANLPVQIYDDTLIEYAVNTDVIKVFLYDNFSNLIAKNNSGNGWRIPANSGDRALDFNAILGSSPENYWRYAPKLYRKQSKIFINEIPIDAGKGQNIKVLIIGDSLTNYNIYPNRAGELANSDENATIKFIGTRGDNTKHEGRGGWSAKIYTTRTQYNSYNNPFINNGKFDFSHYMNTNNFSDVDIVIINLGTNDVTLNKPDMDNDFSEDFKAYDEMISSIKAYDSNIKIALGSTIEPARLNNAHIDVKTRRQRWNRLMAKYCLDNNYTYIPYWFVVDPINDFKYEDVQIDDYNTATIRKVADSTHPADSGYKKMGDLTYATIKKLAEDIRTNK